LYPLAWIRGGIATWTFPVPPHIVRSKYHFVKRKNVANDVLSINIRVKNYIMLHYIAILWSK